MSGGKSTKPGASGQAKVDYPTVRLNLLSSYDSDEYVEWLVQAGEYVRSCWQSEHDFLNGQPLKAADEEQTAHLWDEFSVDDLTTQRSNALIALKRYRRKRFLEDLTVTGGWTAIKWIVVQMIAGILGAIAVVAFCLLVVMTAKPVAEWAAGEIKDAASKLEKEDEPAGDTSKKLSGSSAPPVVSGVQGAA